MDTRRRRRTRHAGRRPTRRTRSRTRSPRPERDAQRKQLACGTPPCPTQTGRFAHEGGIGKRLHLAELRPKEGAQNQGHPDDHERTVAHASKEREQQRQQQIEVKLHRDGPAAVGQRSAAQALEYRGEKGRKIAACTEIRSTCQSRTTTSRGKSRSARFQKNCAPEIARHRVAWRTGIHSRP